MCFKMKIRKARKNDLKDIAKLFVNEYNEGWKFKDALIKVKYLSKKNDIFVLDSNKKVIGVVIVEIRLDSDGNAGYVNELIVNGRFQGKGYGKTLMSFVEDYVKKKKGKSIQLIAGRKEKAFKFYGGIGYKDVKDIAYMTKELK